MFCKHLGASSKNMFFCLASFLTFFTFFYCPKHGKLILTSIWHAQLPNTGQNIQHMETFDSWKKDRDDWTCARRLELSSEHSFNNRTNMVEDFNQRISKIVFLEIVASAYRSVWFACSRLILFGKNWENQELFRKLVENAMVR